MNQVLTIQGGKPLKGQVEIKGAKNSLPKEMVAALLTTETSLLRNISKVEDIALMTKIFQKMEVWIEEQQDSLLINPAKMKKINARELSDCAGKSRIPILLCGPLLHRFKVAVVPKLGGCDIGPRPINFHIQALQKLGARYEEKREGYYFYADELNGAKITLDYPSVGATEQVLLSSVLARGTTELKNAAVEPEIMDLIAVLQKMGAIIAVDTDRTIIIKGVETLRGFEHTSISDRLEAASWACAAAATDGRITVKGARQLDLMAFLNKFRRIGGEFDIKDDSITFYRGRELTSISLETDVHPGFSTDYQQPFVVLLTQAHGASVVHETVYENRFGYVEALNKMGAKIQLYQECLGSSPCRFAQMNYRHSAVITGPTDLTGAKISVPDLRAGFSYIVAALTAKGESVVENYQILTRGYQDLTKKLENLGAQIS